MIAALAFFPVDDVATMFNRLKNRAPAAMQSIFGYFEENYVLWRPGWGCRRAVSPRYDPKS